MDAGTLVVVDWGTTAFRAWLLDAEGAILDEIPSGRGMRDLARDAFPTYCAERLAPWRAGRSIPVVMAGMVGAAQGWQLAPQPPLPVTVATLAAGLVAADGLDDAWIVPGARCVSAEGEIDVMRGEEVQIFGALALTGRTGATLCLPGTHSKWARVVDGRLEHFVTHMTGELREILLAHSILAKTTVPGAPFDATAFAEGMAAIRRGGGVLHAAFLVRSLVLWDRLAADAGSSFLTGVLVAAELEAALAQDRPAEPVLLVASEALRGPYETALAAFGVAFSAVPARDATLAGVRAVMRARAGA